MAAKGKIWLGELWRLPRTRTDQRGVIRTFTYDAASRLATDEATTVPAGVDAAVRRVEPLYDDLGRQRGRSSWSAIAAGTKLNEVRRTFDGWGNVIATAQAHSGAVIVGTTPTVSYTWDAGATANVARSLRLTAVSYPSSGQGASYRYPATGLGFALDRPEAIVSGGVDIMQAEFLGAGLLARQTLPRAGLAKVERSTSGAADGYNRFWQVANHAWAVGATQLDGGTFLFDRGGRITAKKASWLTTRADRDDVATYDGLDRVTSFKRGSADAAGVLATASNRDWSWTLDQAGNWRSFMQDVDGGFGPALVTTQSRSHNLANEITSPDMTNTAVANTISGTGVDWIDPVYDAAGAMTTIPTPGTETTSRSLVWDAWGRLVQVKNGVTSIWTAAYDAEHRLIQWTDVAANKLYDSYVDDGCREVEVRSATVGNTAALSEMYVWGSGDQVLRIGTGAGTISTYYAVLTDQQGSVTALVADGTANVVERYRYDAYGVKTIYATDGTTVRATSSYGMRYGYTGRPFDVTTGLGYYRNRWYHASLGRFISRDPAGYVDGGNLYQYVTGNPLWFVDPWGLNASVAPREPSWGDWFSHPIDSYIQRKELAHYRIRNATPAEHDNLHRSMRQNLVFLPLTASIGSPAAFGTVFPVAAQYIEGEVSGSVEDEIHPELGSMVGTDEPPRPKFEPNQAHDPKSPQYDYKKTPEPADSECVYDKSKYSPKDQRWYGVGKNGEIYRYVEHEPGKVHFNGMTGGKWGGLGPKPIKFENVPIEIRRFLGKLR